MDKIAPILYYVTIAIGFVFLWRKPSLRRLVIFTFILATINIVQNFSLADAAGMSVDEFLGQSFNQALQQTQENYSSLRVEETRDLFNAVSVVWVGVEFLRSGFVMVFVMLFARVFYKMRKNPPKVEALSKVDLNIWTVFPLITGVIMLAVSFVLPEPEKQVIFRVALNLIVISTLPLYIQGTATYKGIMNNRGLSFGVQFLITLGLVITGLALIFAPVLGLIDYWANFRKLDRNGSKESEDDTQKQKDKNKSINKSQQKKLPNAKSSNQNKEDAEHKADENRNNDGDKEASSASKDASE